MVGVPFMGKSTWVTEHTQAHPEKDYVVISTDNEVYDIGREKGMTDENDRVRYMDVYTQYYGEAEKRAWDKLNHALKDGRNIIVDRGHHEKNRRRRTLDLIPENYTKKP